MQRPLVAIVGRPNVGKSTFFNRIAGKRLSIVEDMPGVTRDRLYVDGDWNGYAFTMIDTGGLELSSNDVIHKHIKAQAEIAVETANVILFFVDGKSGITSADEEVANFLRRSGKKVIVVVNKIDNYDSNAVIDFYRLGLGEPFPISAEHGQGTGDLLDEMVKSLKMYDVNEIEDEERIKIAVVGKPNAGKSSLVNKLLGYERSIVSNIAGTTRDTINENIEYKGKKYTLIDTAGIRKKSNIQTGTVEYYSVVRAFNAVRQADVVLLVVDSSENLTEQDVKIAGFADSEGIPTIVVMNKWDLIEKDTNTINEFNKKLREDLKFMDYFKTLYISAKTGQRVEQIFGMVDYVYEKTMTRVSTGVLNDAVLHAIATSEPPAKNGKRLKLYFSTQVGVKPPKFVIKVNDVKLIHFSYKRYIENVLRNSFDMDGTPIVIMFRNKSDKED